MIKIDDLSLTFKKGEPLETHALRGLSLNIEKGDFITVIGSNGAGKTSFLNCLAGEIFPDSGKIFILEENVTSFPAEKRAAMVSRVFQDPRLGSCEILSIEENMALAMMRGQKHSMARAVNPKQRHYFRERLTLLNMGLEDRLNDPVGLLSGGQRQALSLIMATLQPAHILLLDEHTAALDPKISNTIMCLTEKIIKQWSLTALMVTHSMRQALDYGNRTVMLDEGQVILDITGQERKKITPERLIQRFTELRNIVIDDDALLLS